MRMRAAVLYAYNEPPKIEEIEIRDPHAEEVLVRIEASGVCHSDLHRVTGDISTPFPVVLGHEAAGVVERVGDRVSRVKPGDRVVLSWAPFCEECYFCLRNQPAQCNTFWELGGKGTLFDGTIHLHKGDRDIHHCCFVSSFAEYTVVPETGCVRISEEVDFDKASLLGCAVTTGAGAAINTAKVEPGSTVAVIGCGGVGLSVIQGATICGAARIIAVDLAETPLKLARELGATDTVNGKEVDAVEAVLDLTGGHGVDYSFEAIGLPGPMAQAYAMARRRGMVVVVGVGPTGAKLEVPADKIAETEKILTGSYYGSAFPQTFIPRLIDLYLSGKLQLDKLATRQYRLDDTAQAIDDLRKDNAGRGVILM